MNMTALFGKVMGFIVIIVTLALAPSINTANTAVMALNTTNLTGLSTIGDFGAPLIVLGLLTSGGLLALAGIKGKLAASGMSDMFSVIGSVVIVIISLNLMQNVVTYTNTLIAASSGFAITIYGIIPLMIYIGIIAVSGWGAYKGAKAMKGGRKSSAGYGGLR